MEDQDDGARWPWSPPQFTLVLSVEACTAPRPTASLKGSREKYVRNVTALEKAVQSVLPSPMQLNMQVNVPPSSLLALAAAASQQPELFVLKPQREGGGNNFYGDVNSHTHRELPATLEPELSARVCCGRRSLRCWPRWTTMETAR